MNIVSQRLLIRPPVVQTDMTSLALLPALDSDAETLSTYFAQTFTTSELMSTTPTVHGRQVVYSDPAYRLGDQGQATDFAFAGAVPWDGINITLT